jgi:hypothetical protein
LPPPNPLEICPLTCLPGPAERGRGAGQGEEDDPLEQQERFLDELAAGGASGAAAPQAFDGGMDGFGGYGEMPPPEEYGGLMGEELQLEGGNPFERGTAEALRAQQQRVQRQQSGGSDDFDVETERCAWLHEGGGSSCGLRSLT